MSNQRPRLLTEKKLDKAHSEDIELQIRLALRSEKPETLKLRRESELGCPVYFRTMKASA